MSGEWSEPSWRSPGGARAEAQAPALRNGAAYAAWHPAMDAWLESHGARGVHRRETSPNEWRTAQESVEQWGHEAFDNAVFLLFGPSAARSSATRSVSGSDDNTAGDSGLTPDEQEARKTITELVENSARVFGVIYEALPAEWRPEIETAVRSGFAHGLWKWLEDKFQSTEQDKIGELLTQWIEMKQGEEESVQAYRARVDKLHALLTIANEKPTARAYSLVMTERLQPRNAPAVLALKAAGALTDADRIDWIAVLAVLNRYEREEQETDAAWVTITREHAANKEAAKQERNTEPAAHSSGAEHKRRSAESVQGSDCDSFGPYSRDYLEWDRNQEANDGGYAGENSGGASSRGGALAWRPDEKAAASSDTYSSLSANSLLDSGSGCERAAMMVLSWSGVAKAGTKTAATAAAAEGQLRPRTLVDKVMATNAGRDSGRYTDAAHAGSDAVKTKEAAMHLQMQTAVRGSQAGLDVGHERASAAVGHGNNVRDDTPNVEALLKLHVRLGHLGFNDLIKLIRSGGVRGLERIALTQSVLTKAREIVRGCDACCGQHGRMIGEYDHRGLVDGAAFAEALHIETYVIRCSGRNGLPSVLHGVIVRDTFSGERWCIEASKKDRMVAELIDALIWIGGQCDGRIRRISCDGGGMLASVQFTDWMQKQRILFRVCKPMIMNQSGGVGNTEERRDTVAAQTLLEFAGAPMWMWSSAMSHAIYLSNSVRIHHANGQTVYEMKTGRKPSVPAKKIGVWGCDCYVKPSFTGGTGAVAADAEPGVYLGHNEDQKASLVMLLRTGKCVVTNGVVFVNDRFTHLRAVASEGGVDAVDESDHHWITEEDSSETHRDSSQAQGGMEQPSAPDAEMESEATVDVGASSGSDTGEWPVESIVAHKGIRGRDPKFLVRWAGFGEEHDSWLDLSAVDECAGLDRYYEEHPEADVSRAEVAEPRRSPRFNSGMESEASAMTLWDSEGDAAAVSAVRFRGGVTEQRSLFSLTRFIR